MPCCLTMQVSQGTQPGRQARTGLGLFKMKRQRGTHAQGQRVLFGVQGCNVAVVHKLPNHGCVSRQHHRLPACLPGHQNHNLLLLTDNARVCAQPQVTRVTRCSHRRCRARTHVPRTTTQVA